MSEHRARIAWIRGESDFSYETYSRDHAWSFEGAGHIRTRVRIES